MPLHVVAKIVEAIGIACVMIGLVQGIQTDDMWIELYLSLAGIALFLVGWGIERWLDRRNHARRKHPSAETR